MRKSVKVLSVTVIICLLLAITQIVAFAAGSTSISVSSSTVYVGTEFTVTVKFNATETFYALQANVSYDSSVVEFVPSANVTDGGGMLNIATDNDSSSKSIPITFKAIKAGSCKFEVTNATYANPNEFSMSGSSRTVNVVNKTTPSLSSNANLKSLKISAGTLSPAFDPNITSYDVRLTYEQTQVLVTATTAEYSASCYVEGSSTMKVGQNKRVIVVTAPNGTVKKYTLNIHRDENPGPNPYEITVGADKKYIVTDYKNINIPFGYELSKYTINATSMSVMYDKVSDAVLVYATNKDGTGGSYYSMDKESGAFAEYKFFLTGNTQYVALEPEAGLVAPVGYYYAPVEIMGYTVNAFKYDDEAYADFIIFFARTKDGQTGFFRYDVKDSSVQRAIEFTAALSSDTTVDTPNVESEKSFWQKLTELEAKSKIVLIAGIVAILVIIAIVVILIVGAVRNKKPEDETFVMPDSIDLKEEFTDSLEQMRDLSDFADSSEIDFPETEDTDINE